MIEESHRFPVLGFGLKEGEELGGDDDIFVALAGVRAEGSFFFGEPGSETFSLGKLVLGIGEAFVGVGGVKGGVIAPILVRRVGLPFDGHAAEGKEGSGFAEGFFEPKVEAIFGLDSAEGGLALLGEGVTKLVSELKSELRPALMFGG